MISCCYELKNKFAELGRERMSDDFMELNDMELNYGDEIIFLIILNFGDETDSIDASNNLDEGFAL